MMMTMVAYMQETLVSKWSLNLTQQCLEKSRIMESRPAKILPRQIKSLLPLVDVLTSFGEKFTKSEARKLVQTASKKEDGLIDYKGQ